MEENEAKGASMEPQPLQTGGDMGGDKTAGKKGKCG